MKGFTHEAIDLRHQLHRNPELKYEEVETAELVTKELERYGYEVKTGIGKTGVTALLDSGRPGPVVALRADLDALPICEQTGLDYSSKNPGKMHACGHDGHTATLLLVARVLKEHVGLLPCGAIKFIFQPAEEGGAGAYAMIQEGVLESPKVDAIFGYHNFPGTELGHVIVRSGCFMAGANMFKVTVTGKGGHAAYPEACIDPVVAAAALIQNTQSIISRNISSGEQGIISITQLNAGTAHNVIADDVELQGTIRATSPKAMDYLIERFESVVKHSVATFGAEASIEYTLDPPYPPTMNHPKESELVHQVAKESLGENRVHWLDGVSSMGGEDFAFYLQEVPGCYFGVGNGMSSPSLHNGHYDYSDEILADACQLLCHTAIAYIQENAATYSN
ncbi:hypothetical protein BGC07_10485 [Piscirickettsia litoralis]|uniref:Peptidase M20 dimerisation domain-containing protein n=1 Tax=Piscirickettsia litoralis TaxID=1891921 RepID=A0ABX3A5D8_9GAMM|nr:hypothetical protein BGC07_10485 [Piscirickettsia litoralis]